jgi:hypothetical protein
MPGGIYRSEKMRGRAQAETQLVAPAVKVVASPTDPFIRTFKDDPTNNIFAQLSGLVKSTGKAAVIGAQEASSQGEREWNPAAPDIEGPNGELIPGTESTREAPKGLMGKIFTPAYKTGYDRIDGEHKASLYYNEAYQYAQDNKLQTKQELEAGLGAIRQKYMGSMVSDVQMDAWLPKAAAVEEKLIHDHVVEGVKLQHNEATVALNGVLRDRAVSNILMPELATIGITSLEQLKTDEGIDLLQDNIATIGPALRSKLRTFLTSAQIEFGGTHSKAEISEMVTNLMIGIAGETLTPELLDFAKEGESDAPGAPTLRDRNDPQGNNLGSRIDHADKQIEQSRHTMVVQRREEKRRVQAEAVQKASVDYALSAGKLWNLPVGEYPAALEAMERQKEALAAMPGITVSQYVEAGQILNSIAKRGSHPAATPPEVEEAFWTKFSHGDMTVGYVAQHWREYSEQDMSTFYSLAGHQASQRMEKDRAKRDEYFSDREMNKLAYDEIEKEVNPTDPAGLGKLDDNGATNAIEARNMLATLSNQWSKKNGNKAPDEEALDKIRATVRTKYPPFKAPSASEWATAEKQLTDSPQGFPATQEAFQARYNSLTTMQRYVVSSRLKGQAAPKPPVKRSYK